MAKLDPKMKKVTEIFQFETFVSDEVILNSKDHLRMELYPIEGFYGIRGICEN